MGFNGAGTFSRITPAYSGSTSWQQEEAGGFGKVAVRHDIHDQDIAAGLSNCITKDGQTTPTGNIPIGGNNLVNVGTGTSRSSLATIGEYQDGGRIWAGVIPNTGNSYTGTPTPAVSSYVEGMEVLCIPSHTNTASACFFSLSALPAYRISHKREGIADPQINVGEIRSGEILHLIFSSVAGGQWVIANQEYQQWQTWTPTLGHFGGLPSTVTPTLFLTQKYLVKDNFCYWHLAFAASISPPSVPNFLAVTASLPVPCVSSDHFSMGAGSGFNPTLEAVLILTNQNAIQFSAGNKQFFGGIPYSEQSFFLAGSGFYEVTGY